MCHYITAILPEQFRRDAIMPFLKKWKLDFHPIDNEFVTAQLQPKEHYVGATRKVCDCGTPLTSGSRTEAQAAKQNLERQLEKLRKKGWGDHKIQAWLAEQQKTDDRRFREALRTTDTEPEGLERWMDLIGDFLASTSCGYIGLLVHWYSGQLEHERIQLKGNQRIFLSDMDTGRLYNMKEDTVYRIAAKD